MMSRKVSYSEQTTESRLFMTRFAHRARYKVSLELASNLLPKDGMLVDFGAGEGKFLDQIGAIRPDVALVAIEPYMEIRYANIKRAAGFDELKQKSVDVVGAFEVLEHLSDVDLERFFVNVRQVLKPGGRLLITVPIMYGLMLPVKEVSRSLLHGRRSDMGLGDFMKSTFGLPIARPIIVAARTRGSTSAGWSGNSAIASICCSDLSVRFRICRGG